jgi:transcriptional regulator with XRE-family HTH domain
MSESKALKKMLVEIGVQLARLREKKGFATIREFAQKYDLPEIQYWRMEKGKANITLKSLMKVLSIHKITLEEFFCEVTAQKMAA